MHNVSYIWRLTCNLYRVLPYRIDFGALVDTARIQGMFRARLLKDVSRGLHGFAPFLKDVCSVLHLGKVYFPDLEGCLQRNHYSGKLSWHWTGSAIKIKAAQAVWPFRMWFVLYAIGENRLCFFLSSLSVSELRCCVCAIEKSIDIVRSSKGILTRVFPIIACFIEIKNARHDPVHYWYSFQRCLLHVQHMCVGNLL